MASMDQKIRRTFEANQQKINSSECCPTVNTLKRIFCWLVGGSISHTEKEWEKITQGKHPDIIQLKRKLAMLSTASKTAATSLRQKSDPSSASLMNTLPGCSIDIQDAKSTAVSTTSDRVDTKDKQPKKGKNSRKRERSMVHLNQHHNVTCEDSDENPVISDIIESLESFEGLIGSSQESNEDMTRSEKPKSYSKNVISDKQLGKPVNQRLPIAIEQNMTGKNPRKATNHKMDITFENIPSKKLKMPTKQMQAVIFEQTRSDELIETSNAVNSNDSRELMKIVKDPYEKTIQGSNEDRQEFTMKRRNKTTGWLAPQKNAVGLQWSSSDEVSEGDICKNVDKKVKQKQAKYTKKRRKQKRYWTTEEMDWIREGGEIYGDRNWSEILRNYPFVDRTSVDIKDKHRNMLHNDQL